MQSDLLDHHVDDLDWGETSVLLKFPNPLIRVLFSFKYLKMKKFDLAFPLSRIYVQVNLMTKF